MTKYRIIQQRSRFATVEHIADSEDKAKELAKEYKTTYSLVPEQIFWTDNIKSDVRDFNQGIYGE